MASRDPHQRLARSVHFEAFEPRLVMSADPVGQIRLDYTLDEQIESLQGDLRSASFVEAYAQAGVSAVVNAYGFQGAGQTVVVIDSGIAWDHYALGGGYGPGYRVVGGWDFTEENDANPYDDGPMGSHGTHVAGIIGADAGTRSGVAPGVDLVALRVFNDQGVGYLSWVEQALKWVHTNRDAFENPITTVNLSLGSQWNAETVPGWATLEDEFAQLEADGIFISVAAGNSFATYNAPGLSYPAVSSHVVPVSSVDANGSFSYYSQRHQRAIAAPGRSITSTVPDYVGNFNGRTDDFAAYSGTSMAAPYVAGASVLVRDAMQFVGYTNITQSTIYDVMIRSADVFYDAATKAYYNRLNLESAIELVMPDDDFGSNSGAAHNLGTLTDTLSVDGLIGRLDDADYFRFAASQSGSVTFSAETTHGMTAQWVLAGPAGSTSGSGGEIFSFDVVAGNTYTVGLSSDSQLGYYTIEARLESSQESTLLIDWGAVAFAELEGISRADGNTWYRLQTTRSGLLTVESFFSAAAGNVDLELYDAGGKLVAASRGASTSERIDANAAAGDVFYVRAVGSNADVDFRVTNLVAPSGKTIRVFGTDGDDTFRFTAGSKHVLSINGVEYKLSGSKVTFDGGAGNDTAELTGTSGNETAHLRVGSVEFVGKGFQATAEGVETIAVHAGSGNDKAYLYDSAGDDVFRAWSTHGTLSGTGFSTSAHGFDKVYAYASKGNDVAYLYDSAGDDLFRAWHNASVLIGNGFYNYAKTFDRVEAYASAGFDQAYLYDSPGNDTFIGTPDAGALYGKGFYNYAQGFDRVSAYATKGVDVSYFYDSSGTNKLHQAKDAIKLSGDGFYNYAKGFDQASYTSLANVDFYAVARGFDSAAAFAIQDRDDWTAIAAVDQLFDDLETWSQKL